MENELEKNSDPSKSQLPSPASSRKILLDAKPSGGRSFFPEIGSLPSRSTAGWCDYKSDRSPPHQDQTLHCEPNEPSHASQTKKSSTERKQKLSLALLFESNATPRICSVPRFSARISPQISQISLDQCNTQKCAPVAPRFPPRMCSVPRFPQIFRHPNTVSDRTDAREDCTAKFSRKKFLLALD